MLSKIKFILLFSLIIIIIGCSNNDKKTVENEIEISLPELEYIKAKKMLDDKDYEQALNNFNKIDKKYPLSNWAIKSKLMSIFIHYLRLEYDIALTNLNRFISKYPDYKDIDYAYYLRALIAYEQIKTPGLDSEYTEKSKQYFEELIRRFPDSKYSKDGNQKLVLINSVLAGKDMHIGFYYLQEKEYLAALNRYVKVLSKYETNQYTPEALHRVVEIYYLLGMKEDAKKMGAVLGYNYPNSIWYNKTYEILGESQNNYDEDLSWSKKLIKKLF